MNKPTRANAYEEMLNGVTKTPPRPSPPPVETDVDFEPWGACASLARMKGLYGLGIKRPGMPDKVIEYHDVEGEGDNSRIEVIMGARKTWLIKVTGARLLQLLYYIKEHRVDWVRQADRGFDPDDGKPFIERVEITDITPKQ